MSSKRTTAPPTPKHSRSSSSGRKGLIAKKKHETQSAKKRTTLDNLFHRTVLTTASPPKIDLRVRAILRRGETASVATAPRDGAATAAAASLTRSRSSSR